MGNNPLDGKQLTKLASACVSIVSVILVLLGLMLVILFSPPTFLRKPHLSKGQSIQPLLAQTQLGRSAMELWTAPDSNTISLEPNATEIQFGRDLISHTSEYLGPKGRLKKISNGMNCQNCHLNAGTKPFGNNYSAVASTYPKVRPRSGSIETIEKRVNDCIERSLNGKVLENNSHEMKAMVAYIKWIGKNVPKDSVPRGSGLVTLPYLDQAANPEKGRLLYDLKCTVCHGKNGEGILNADGTTWTYPPLWGKNSYNVGAGLFRLSRFAGYIKVNMPWGSTYNAPQLTDEEAWHIASFVNSMPRPIKDLSSDWPDISKKPIDHPFGPYIDEFDERQHKYGPFKPIIESRKELAIKEK
jgi:cytochrome c